MDKTLEQTLVNLMGEIQKGVIDVAPKAYEMAVKVSQLQSWVSFIEILVTISIGIALLFTGYVQWGVARKKDKDYPFDTANGYISIGLGLVGALLTFASTGTLAASSSMWITMIDPEMGFLVKLYDKFM